MKTIYLAGGCFWGVQRFFDQFDGVISTEAGYANGPDRAPSYRDVCGGSGHAETVKIDYDPDEISLTDLLNCYFDESPKRDWIRGQIYSENGLVEAKRRFKGDRILTTYRHSDIIVLKR